MVWGLSTIFSLDPEQKSWLVSLKEIGLCIYQSQEGSWQ